MTNCQTLPTEKQDLGPFFSQKELASIDCERIPTHVAIIPDGNRRWAKKRLFGVLQGHVAGAENVVTIVRAAKELGIKTLTMWGFSTENWKRPLSEMTHLMSTIEAYLVRYQQMLVENGIRLRAIGNLEKLSKSFFEILQKTVEMTKECSGFECILAINYGGRDEILRAMHALLDDVMQKKIEHSALNEGLFSSYLDTKGMGDPDLIIRTSGELRISNFLLWQSAYSELYIDTTCWPDFTPKHLLAAIASYQRGERRIVGG